MKTTSLLMLLILLLNSCQSSRELHYFKSGENYYRLNIKAKSFASKSRYISGYFDDKAVEKYFSELNQPDSANTVKWSSAPNNNSKLVMILSSNSNSISEQIGSFASNEETLELIARMANIDKITKVKETENKIAEIDSLDKDIKDLAEGYLSNISKSKNPENDLKDFLIALQTITKGKLNLNNIELAKYKLK
jgi:hypothetical protein